MTTTMYKLALAATLGLVLGACSRDRSTPSETPAPNYQVSRPSEPLQPATPSPAQTAAQPPPDESQPAAGKAEARTEESPALKLDVVYVPTPQPVVDKMLELAKVTKNDVVYDLGSGDGRIVVTAAKRHGAKGYGFDLDPARVAEARENARTNGVEHLVTIEQKDIFTVDLSPATVVTLYLLPDLNVRLIPQLQKLRSGARVVSHNYDMGTVQPLKQLEMHVQDDSDAHYVYLWHAPIRP